MNPTRRFILLLILGLAGIVGFRQARDIGSNRKTAEALSAERLRLRAERERVESTLPELRAETERAEAERALCVARWAAPVAGAATRPLDPDMTWSQPPEGPPTWEVDSPYVWLDKKILSGFSVNTFESDGGLKPEMAAVLTVDPGHLAALNQDLAAIVTEQRREELAHAHVVPEPLPAVAREPGDKLTVRLKPMSEISTRSLREFEGTLVRHVGKQRAEILMRVAQSWLAEAFPESITQPRTTTVVVRADGSYRIASENSFGSMQLSGDGDFGMYIPMHLRPLFEPLRRKTGDGAR